MWVHPHAKWCTYSTIGPVYEMLRFAGNLEECRKVQFAKQVLLHCIASKSLMANTFSIDSPPDRFFRYFSTSSSLSINAWSTDGKDTLTRCGHCDNCTRPPEAIEQRDVTVQAWQLMKIVEAIAAEGGRVTLGMLADLARGAGGGAFGVGDRNGKGKPKEKVGLDLETICRGKVDMSRDVGWLAGA
jgi:ATP-dependent DNA helicase Q1